MLIDLHTHSCVSDGTDEPAALMRAAARAGLGVVALTDHDTTAGWAEAEAAVGTTGVALVRGTEISCTGGGISVHLLSYLHDPAEPRLAETFRASREFRDTRARRMVDLLAVDYDLTWADVAAQAAPGATIGRPHIADALVARGVVRDRSAAFASLLRTDGPYYVRYRAPDAVEAVRMVVAAGGVPVFAHPRAAARGRVVSDETIAEMAEAGLAGLEVDHRDHTERDKAELGVLADSWGLLRTGSSDYHGTGKPNRLGEHRTRAAVLDAIAERGSLEVLRP